ncbi:MULTISPECIES: hypothetical protein [Xanthomonas]|uniref:Uncharacterized protein n=1 Tax=Xanthomonas cucurbitae TaxID=56453 RepID=A0A2S7DN79_9XANT|nr:hypothetical protein [Xanthomonas cucurbitae]PPU75254.1 hypothetical protein XcuCFBP2542_14930 [Xanthomonas cucurbitae]QHG87625.1 hypothetical protein EBN15_12445 [Xanthomonas cucurbitae]WDM66488.1 hypothetical protein K6981_13135 [Xanthomonas cucurbitae]WDM70367.1 hypothetical protein K6978_13105 [Xanthomonas cucurbitae]WDM74241.1 hypothetical protein K6982_12465 [Xanthomonas cucurbitae]
MPTARARGDTHIHATHFGTQARIGSMACGRGDGGMRSAVSTVGCCIEADRKQAHGDINLQWKLLQRRDNVVRGG